jgi:hypothetical protein
VLATRDGPHCLNRLQPRRGVLILEREWRGPDGTKSRGLCTLEGRGREGATGGGFPCAYIFRPAYIYPVEPRQEPNFSYRLLRGIYPVFRVLFPNQVIPADDLARAMVDVAVRRSGESGGVVLENRDIRAIVEA